MLIRTLLLIKFFAAKNKFKLAFKPYDFKDVIEQYKQGNADILVKIKDLHRRIEQMTYAFQSQSASSSSPSYLVPNLNYIPPPRGSSVHPASYSPKLGQRFVNALFALTKWLSFYLLLSFYPVYHLIHSGFFVFFSVEDPLCCLVLSEAILMTLSGIPDFFYRSETPKNSFLPTRSKNVCFFKAFCNQDQDHRSHAVEAYRQYRHRHQ